MAYTKTTWQNGVTPVNADNMNKIEDELETLESSSAQKYLLIVSPSQVDPETQNVLLTNEQYSAIENADILDVDMSALDLYIIRNLYRESNYSDDEGDIIFSSDFTLDDSPANGTIGKEIVVAIDRDLKIASYSSRNALNVFSIDGHSGGITLGEGLSIDNNNVLSASGGGSGASIGGGHSITIEWEGTASMSNFLILGKSISTGTYGLHNYSDILDYTPYEAILTNVSFIIPLYWDSEKSFYLKDYSALVGYDGVVLTSSNKTNYINKICYLVKDAIFVESD